MRSSGIYFLFICLSVLSYAPNLSWGYASQKEIVIFHADGLNLTLREIEKAFLRHYPDTRVIREASGSRLAAKKITELGRIADILIVADYKIIEELEAKKLASWQVKFLKDEMVIAYTDKSRYTNEINRDNWYEILLREGVSYGLGNPDLDPCGYRAWMVWKLADSYYQRNLHAQLLAHCPLGNIRPDAAALLPLLESLYLDYAFLYGSVAKQHNLKVVILPEEINLSNPSLEPAYAQVEIDLNQGRSKITGAPILFSLTIPENARNKEGALKFIRFLFSPEGRKITADNFQPQLNPPETDNLALIPLELKEFLPASPPK
jgi:molybdate/tungstate transport system substrate-binding protein